MKNRIHFTLLLLLISFFAIAQKSNISGRIYNAKNNEPLPFANIVIFGTNIGATSDIDGKYSFTGVKPGYVKLVASSIGFDNYVSEEFMVSNSRSMDVDIPMIEKVINLQGVDIKASPFERKEESPISMRSLGISDIEKNPGGNRDISKVIQSYPGVAATPAFRNDIVVRGGGTGENRFYLDDVEIPNLNHFATQGASGGPVGIINTDFLREVEFYSGAFPASYGNAMSSVIDMKQIDPNHDKLNAKAALGASDLAVTLNTPLGKDAGMIFSVRRSYLQLLFTALQLPFLPTYNDYQLKVKIDLDKKNQLTFISLGAYDQSSLNLKANKTESQRYILSYLPVYNQWNYTIGAVYRHFRKNSFDTWVLSRNMLRNSSYKYFKNDESVASNKLSDYTSDEIENKIRYENTTRTAGFKIIYGAGAEYAKYTNKTYQKAFVNNLPLIIDYHSFLEMYKWNLFGQVSKNIFGERLALSLGIRADANNYSSSMQNLLNQFSPRFSASWMINENWSLNFNTGRYYQQPPYTMLGYRNSAGALVNRDHNLKYISVDHYVAGVAYQDQKNFKVSVEGFYKMYHNYPFSVNDSICLASAGADFGVFGNEEVVSRSKGRAFGVEVLGRVKMWKGFNGIASYTYVRSEFQDKNNNYVPSAWDSRHLVSMTLSKTFKRNWSAGFKWRYVSGTPYTPWNLNVSSQIAAWDAQGKGYLDYSRFNTERLKAFTQLDVRVDKTWFFKRWSLNLYVDVQNLYNSKLESPPNLIQVTDANGAPLTDPADNTRYLLKSLNNTSGTILPTLGIIVEI
ncbi:MAG: TonB-dependent receptor [Bacteroidota bacterium]